MPVINLIKVGVIWLCDTINRLYDPFVKATYAVPTDLDELERMFYQDTALNFVHDGEFKYQLPVPFDSGDTALFQGLYVAMMNFKHKEPTPELQQANMALGKLFVDGRLIRGVRGDGTINDTTSNDSATGVLFGLYSIWLRGTWEADATIQRWTDSIVADGMALADLNGIPTPYGRLEQGWKTDPLRLTLLLAILALAMRVAPTQFRPHYEQLYRTYRGLLRYPKVKLLWWDTDYDTHRAAIHLHVLFKLTGDKIYADGLRRIHRITGKSNNAWVELLCSPALPDEAVDLSIMHTFDFWRRQKGNVASIDYVMPTVNWGGKERSLQAKPIWARGSQEFFWQRNMFSIEEWKGKTVADVRHSGLDFLLVFWYAVRLGLLTEPQTLPPTKTGVI